MATGKSGYLSTYNAGKMYVTPHYVEEYDNVGNYSIIKIDYIDFTSSHYEQSVNWDIAVSFDINGVEYSFSGDVTTHSYTAQRCACSIVSNPIYHNEDGSKSITITMTYAWWVNGSVGYRWEDSGALSTSTIALTTIPRASELSVSNGTLGVAQTLTIDKKSDSYIHSISYTCGSAEETWIVWHDSSPSISWTPPLELASQNTTGTSVPILLTIHTYTDDGTWLAWREYTISCAIPQSVKPSVSMTITDANGYASKYGGYVQKQSKLKVVLNVTESYGSEIAVSNLSFEGITYQGATIETAIINGSGVLTVKATVTDKRGRTGTATATVDVLAYSPPAITKFTANRSDADGTDNPVGDYAEATMSAKVTALNGNNSAIYKLQYKARSATTWSSYNMTGYNNVYVLDDVAVFAASADYSYNVIFTVSDDFNSISSELPLQVGKVAMHKRAKGKGMGLGRICEDDYLLDVDWDIRGRKNLHIDGTVNSVNGFRHNDNTIDSVVEEKEVQSWTYRLWNSGLAECWCRTNEKTVNCTSAWGNLFYGDTIAPAVGYPITFIDAPTVVASPEMSTGDYWLCVGSPGTTTQSPQYHAIRPTQATVTGCVSLYARGRWK